MAIIDQCSNPVSNSLTSNPALSSFPCDLLNLLGISNISSTLQSPSAFDYSIYTNILEQLSAVGDPRWSMGAMFTDLLDNIGPLIVAQTEIQQAGGCQIIDQFICDANGKPIKSTTSTCSAINNQSPAITPTFLQNYIQTKLLVAKTSAADNFISFLNETYVKQGWNITGYSQPTYGLFYLAANKPSQGTVYFKYYPDQMGYISKQLNISIQTIQNISTAVGNFNSDLQKVLTSPIGSY